MSAPSVFPTDGSVWIDILEDGVVLNLDPTKFTTANGFSTLTPATIKSIVLTANSNGNQVSRSFKLADCKTLVDGVPTLVTEYSLEGLGVEQYFVSAQIYFGATIKNYGARVSIIGTPDTPVIVSIAPRPGTMTVNNVENTAVEGVQLIVTPHDYSGDNPTKTDAITYVIFTATDSEENLLNFPPIAHDANGKYSLVSNLLVLGTEYYFTCQMQTASALSDASEPFAFTIVDTVDPEAGKLSLELSNDTDVRVNIAAQEYDLLTGLEAGAAEARKALNLLVRYGFADRALIDQDVETIVYAAPTSYPLRPSQDGLSMIIDAFNFVVTNAAGRELHASYAIQSLQGTSPWTADVEYDVKPVLTAPTLTAVESADGSYVVTASVAQSPLGAVLLGYRFETLNAAGTAAAVTGAWSVDDEEEIIIAGSLAGASITLSAFDGIVGQGDDLVPEIAIKSASLVYTHNGAGTSPDFQIRATAIYGQLDDFEFDDFVKLGQRYVRSDLALATDGLHLEVVDKDLIAIADFVASEQVVSAKLKAPVAMSAIGFVSANLAIDDEEGEVTATHTITATNAATAKTFADNQKATLGFVLVNNKTGDETDYIYDAHEQKYVAEFDLESGLQDFSYYVEAKVGRITVGKSVATAITGLPQLSGPNRLAQSGKIAARSAPILLADDKVMEKGTNVVALAIETRETISAELDVVGLVSTDYTRALTVNDIESFDQVNQKWVLVATGLTVTPATTTKSYTVDDVEKGWDKSKKYGVVLITGTTALVQYRCRVRRNFLYTGDVTKNFVDYMGDEGYVKFVRTSTFTAPAVTVTGDNQQVIAKFSQPLTGALSLDEKKQIAVLSQGELSNDLYLNGDEEPVYSGSDSQVTEEAEGNSARVEGAQSYVNPNVYFTQNKLVSVDPERVSSAKSAAQIVNIAAGPVAATDVEFSTVVKTANDVSADNLRVTRAKANETSVSYHVNVSVDDSTVVNADKHFTVLPPWTATTEDPNVMEAFITIASILTGLGNMPIEDFMEADISVNVIASSAATISSTSKQTSSAVQTYVPNCVPTLALADFKIDILSGSFTVTIEDDLTKQQLGGFSSLQAQIIATQVVATGVVPMKYGNQSSDVQTLTAAGLIKTFGPMLAGDYTLSCVLTGGDENYPVSKTIDLGKRALGSAMQAAKNYKVYRAEGTSNSGPVATVLTASWEKETVQADYALSSQTIYVKTKNNAGADQWLTYTATGDYSPSVVETAFKTVANNDVTLAIDRLTTGQEYTVVLQTVYKKAAFADIVVRVSDYDIPSSEPSFTHLAWSEPNALLTAQFKDGGAAIQEILLLAYYDESKPAGDIFMKIDLSSLSSLDAAPNQEIRLMALPADTSKPVPKGLMAILRNANGVDIRVHPSGTYGSTDTIATALTAAQIAALPKFKTTFA